jgi:hypothetical protein
VCCDPISFTFLKHVLDLKYFTGTNTFEHVEFKSEKFPLRRPAVFLQNAILSSMILSRQIFYCSTTGIDGDSRLCHSKGPISTNQSTSYPGSFLLNSFLMFSNLFWKKSANVLDSYFADEAFGHRLATLRCRSLSMVLNRTFWFPSLSLINYIRTIVSLCTLNHGVYKFTLFLV